MRLMNWLRGSNPSQIVALSDRRERRVSRAGCLDGLDARSFGAREQRLRTTIRLNSVALSDRRERRVSRAGCLDGRDARSFTPFRMTAGWGVALSDRRERRVSRAGLLGGRDARSFTPFRTTGLRDVGSIFNTTTKNTKITKQYLIPLCPWCSSWFFLHFDRRCPL
jgi:hypothetical protein